MKTQVLLCVFLLQVLTWIPATLHADVHIFNPHWSIIIDDFGYSDLAFDQRPGFEGREYLSGEWAAAISYVASGNPVVPTWLTPEFIYPDWFSNSDFGLQSAAQPVPGTNSYGFPVYASVIANAALEITIRSDMVDTLKGIPQGLAPASGAAGSKAMSDRYVFRQSFAIRNISGDVLDTVQFFKFLHALEASWGVYDDRDYGGTFNGHRYTITQRSLEVEPDPGQVVHLDTLSLHANRAPAAWEVGYYGIEGADSHFIGKPSVGVHWSVEADTLSGLDFFDPGSPWVSGAVRCDLGTLAAGATTNIEFLMSVHTTSVAKPPFKIGTASLAVEWGDNSAGQTNVPAGMRDVSAIAAGDKHSLVLRSDGTVVAWGNNSSGQTNVPVGLGLVRAIAAGGKHSLALRTNNTVAAWGDNSAGQLNVPAGLAGVWAIAAGHKHSLAIRNNYTVAAWGDNSAGQTNVPPGLTDVRAVAAGGKHSLARRTDGTVVAWGDNSFGQTDVPGDLINVWAIAAGGKHSLALRNDGVIIAWGDNDAGQIEVPGEAYNVVAIAAGDRHSLALRDDGMVVAWGTNTFGQTSVPGGLPAVRAVAAGGSNSLVRCSAPDLVRLAIKLSGTNVVLSWPAGYSSYETTNVVLEAANRIGNTNWVPMAGLSLVNGGNYETTVPVAAPTRFFRLMSEP